MLPVHFIRMVERDTEREFYCIAYNGVIAFLSSFLYKNTYDLRLVPVILMFWTQLIS